MTEQTFSYASQRKKLRKTITAESTCVYCNCYFDLESSANSRKSSLTIDHIVPQSKGGGNELENLVPACLGCNTRKSSHEDKIILFRINNPRKLKDHQYDNIFRYLNSLSRVSALENVKRMVEEDKMEEAIDFMEKVTVVRPGKVFKAVIRVIKQILNSVSSIILQVKKILQEINSILNQELGVFKSLHHKIKDLNVVPYSLIG